MNLAQLQDSIKARRKRGETYESIAAGLGINKAMVRYIEIHENYKPSRRIRAILNLDPDSDLAYTRKRQEMLDQIAQKLGYPSWCAYGTAMLREQKDGG